MNGQNNTLIPTNIPAEYHDESKYKIAKNGVIISKATGRIVTGKYATNAKTMGQEYHNRQTRDKLSGMVQKFFPDIEVESLTNEELEEYAGNARKIMYVKLIDVYMESGEIKGMLNVLEHLNKGSESKADKKDDILTMLLVQYVKNNLDKTLTKTEHVQNMDNILDVDAVDME